MAKRNRDRKPARRTPYKNSKPLILVITEGATEHDYIDTFTKHHKNSRVDVQIHGKVGVPITIVEYAKILKLEKEAEAKSKKDDFIKFDEVWCVFDVDEHPKIPEAVQLASSSGLCLAISNPCFELWLWLHFAPQPGAQHRHKLQSMLQEHIPDYDKHVNFSDISHGYKGAVSRSEKLEDEAREDGEDGRNPTTGVWRLTQSILGELDED